MLPRKGRKKRGKDIGKKREREREKCCDRQSKQEGRENERGKTIRGRGPNNVSIPAIDSKNSITASPVTRYLSRRSFPFFFIRSVLTLKIRARERRRKAERRKGRDEGCAARERIIDKASGNDREISRAHEHTWAPESAPTRLILR